MADPTLLRPEQPAFWQERYDACNLPWDLGQPAPPFVTLFRSKKTLLPPGKIAVLGAGAGHDAALFGQHGFSVIGFDFAPGAIELARSRYNQWAEFVQADIFELPPQYAGAFDYVLEHTCFCAIPPKQREAYVKTAAWLLKPGGLFIGLFWAHQEHGGPPYKTDVREIKARFSPYFEVLSCRTPRNSVSSRSGQERLCLMRRL